MSKNYFVGSGIASLAGAVVLIRDVGVSGKDIVIFEESHAFGGAFDAHGDAEHGYFMSGSRMFEAMYRCTFDLMASIPSVSNPNISVKEETDEANAKWPWHNKVRLVDREGHIPDFHKMGFAERDRIDLVKIIAEPESLLDGKRITDCFGAHFFETNFWMEWCTLFAFERWHSAIEFKRYLQRFIHPFSTIDTQEGVYRSLYNQCDSFIVPIVRWLKYREVDFRPGVRVNNLGFTSDSKAVTVTGIEMTAASVADSVAIDPGDLVFVTNGSMTADKTFGSMTAAAPFDRSGKSGAWCQRRSDFRPVWRCKTRPFPARRGCLQKGPRSEAFLQSGLGDGS